MPSQPNASQAAASSRARQNVEHLVERNRRDRGVAGRPAAAVEVNSVAIIGAGLMGTAIAAANVKSNLPVVLTDRSEDALKAAPERIVAELAQGGEGPQGHLRSVVRRLVSVTADEAEVGACNLVLESVAESLSEKQMVYARIEPRLASAAILASNSSTIPVAQLAGILADPGRFLGLHFFHPVARRPLVEVVRGPKTTPAAVAAAVAYAKRIGKMPIVVDDGPGFLVNRLLLPYLNEALELLLDGARIEELDQAATRFGMAMGPLRIMDEIGIDTTLSGGRVLWEAFAQRIVPSPLLIGMFKSGWLGKKSGAGFYEYPKHGIDPTPSPRPNPHALELIARWARASQPPDEQTITDRLMLTMVLEATRLLEENRVRDPGDIDLGVVFGLGFPADRGGLLWWADTLGPQEIVRRLRRLEGLGPRAQPTDLLLEMAAGDRRFYPPCANLTQSGQTRQ